MSSSESDEFEVIDQLEASLSPEELAKVQTWLQPTGYGAQSSEFHRHLSSQAPGTGLWICETSKYQQWQKSVDHGSLWIKGVPGAGKSVTAASMIENLQKTKGSPVLYFFFRYIISANRRPRSLIQDFLAQLLPYSARLQATLQPLIATGLEDFSDEILWEHLLTGLSSIEKAYCVVDALDEMELLPDDGFLDRLNNLATFRPNNVKLIMTSRPKQHLQVSLRDASIVHISLEDDLVGKDIRLFLSYRLKNLIPEDYQQQLRESLVAAISERSRGLFLYARLLLDQIIPILGSTQLDIEGLVKNLPVGLEEMYNSMLFQQAGSLKIDIQIQVFLLELATHSSRALRLNELASVLASTFPPSMIPGSPKFITRSACAPLLEILEDETVQVIHHSLTEFLLNGDRINVDLPGETPQFPVLNPNKVHKRLSVICLDYLRLGGLRLENAVSQHKKIKVSPYDFYAAFNNHNKETDGYDYQEAKLRYPFLEYAIGNWAFHASKYDFDDDDFFQSIAYFLDPNSSDFRKWVELEWTKGPTSSEFQAPTPLHIAAFAGLTTYAERLIEGELSVDPRDAEDRTPLHWACARGHTSMASLLLKSGATPDAEDCRGVKPIHEAARKNHSSIVRMLLEAGVDPLTPKTHEDQKHRLMCGQISTKGETAVEYVYLQGHTDTAMVMLPFITQETLEEMFCQCCRYGKFEAVRAILKASSLSPNTKSSGATALYLACLAHSVGIVELLLAKGADVHQTSKWRVKNRKWYGSREHEEPQRTPIHAVAIGWTSANNIACQQILRLLLNAGADIEVKDADGDTPLLSLFSADDSPEDAAVKGFLQAGANVLAVNRSGDSMLHRCLSGPRNIQTLKLLFEYGACADSLRGDGDTLLHTAIKHSYLNGPPVISTLLKIGARCDVKNKHGSTAVENAAGNFHCSLEVFVMLLQACSDADVLKRCMWKLCSRKTVDETVKFIRALQRFGVSLEDRDNVGKTVLLCSTRSKVLFDAFLECGADLNVVDSEGKGVLHHYVSGCHGHQEGEALRRLVDMVGMGLNPRQVDYDGNNLLHVQAKNHTGKDIEDLFVLKFLDYGISINSKNNQGMTPLHVHLENWDFDTTRAAVTKRLHERFHERLELPLMKTFQRSQEILNINSQDTDGVTIFHLAALRSEACLFHLLEEGADPHVLTKNGRNALHLACRARQSNIVGYLCQTYKVMINQRDSYGRTPLHDACISGLPESVHHLLKAGADITIVDSIERTPLHACAEFSDEQKRWTLLSRRNEASGQFYRDRFRPAPLESPLFEPWYVSRLARQPSVTYRDQENNFSIDLIVRTLLSAGNDAIALDSHNQTPLDLAIQYDCQEMVQALQFSAELVKKAWDIKPEDRRLQTVIALQNWSLSRTDLQEPLRQELFQNPWMYLSFLTFGDIEWMSTHGGNITGTDETKPGLSGQSLLYIAASKGLTQMAERFGTLARVNDDSKIVLARIHELSSDSNYNPAIEFLAPTLHVACARELSNMDMIDVLVNKCGVNVNARALVRQQEWDKVKEAIEGGTALHTLAKANYWWQLDAVSYLLQKGAEIDSVNEKGETPLHIACTGTSFEDMNCTNNVYGFWRIECVKRLLDLGANLKILDNDGLSCLHKASSSPQIMRILLENGADLSAGKLSPLFPAIQIQCLETVTILLDAGLSPNVMDHNAGSEGFQIDNLAREKAPRWALFCASFANLHNQRPKNSAPIVKLLIERGANLHAPLNDKETLICYAFEHAECEIVHAFLDCAPKIDFKTRDSLGRPVFLAACDWRRSLPGYEHRSRETKATAPFLRILELGADPLVVDNEGRTALHHLLDNPKMNDNAIIQFLALDAAKTLLHQKDGKGFTPLNCALRCLRPAVVEGLLTMGADLLSPDPNGATALHHIAAQCLGAIHLPRECVRQPEFFSGILALWEKFLALGGSINVRDNKGSPPLFTYLSSSQVDNYAATEDSCCHLENFATYFSEKVAKDVDFHAKNKIGESALHIIARREKSRTAKPNYNKDLYEFFVGKRLNPLDEDERGRSSLDIAAACEQMGILELFQYGK